MEASTKVFTFFIMVNAVVLITARSVRISLDELGRSLERIESEHSGIYESIRERRFADSDDIVSPPQTIRGMEPIEQYLRDLEREQLSDSEAYLLHYHSLLIFRAAFAQLAAREKYYEDIHDESYPTFYDEVISLDLDTSLKDLRLLMHHASVERPAWDPQVSLTQYVTGMPCNMQCELLQNLYIHQQFKYYIRHAHMNVITIKLRQES